MFVPYLHSCIHFKVYSLFSLEIVNASLDVPAFQQTLGGGE